MQPILKKSAAIQVIGGQYPGFNFAPTKLNIADDPSRSVPLREPSRFSLRDFLDIEFLRSDGCSGLSRSQANWLRLVILATCVLGAESSSNRSHSASPFLSFGLFYSYLWTFFIFGLLCELFVFLRGFLVGNWFFLASSLAISSVSLAVFEFFRFCFVPFPVWTFGLLIFWISCSPRNPMLFSLPGCNFRLGVVFALCVCLCPAGGVAMEPLTAAECRRAEQRQHVFLQNDRVVRHATRDNRYKLLEIFRGWLENEKGGFLEFDFRSKTLGP